MATALTPPCEGSVGRTWCANRPRRPGGVLAATVLGSIINVALSAIRVEFSADAADLQWVVNAYLLPLGALVLLGGYFGAAACSWPGSGSSPWPARSRRPCRSC